MAHATARDLRRPRRGAGLLVLIAALLIVLAASLVIGANPVPLADVWRGLWHPDASEASLIVWTERMPRMALGVLAGAAFGVAGALMQALTRNPLADPGLLGVNAGAGFAVTVGVGFFGLSGVSGYVWFAFLGAACAAVLVYLIGAGGRGTVSPVTLVLAGVALGAVLNGVSTFLSLIDPDVFRSVRSWGLGSIARTGIGDTVAVTPFLVVGPLRPTMTRSSTSSASCCPPLPCALPQRSRSPRLSRAERAHPRSSPERQGLHRSDSRSCCATSAHWDSPRPRETAGGSPISAGSSRTTTPPSGSTCAAPTPSASLVGRCRCSQPSATAVVTTSGGSAPSTLVRLRRRLRGCGRRSSSMPRMPPITRRRSPRHPSSPTCRRS